MRDRSNAGEYGLVIQANSERKESEKDEGKDLNCK